MTNINIKQAIWIIAFMALSGCGDGIVKVSDDELRKKVQECDYAMNMSAAEHQVCANYHRECKRRLKSEGRFVCN